MHNYGVTLAEKGINEAFCQLVALKADAVNYYLDEEEMNALALQLLYQAKFENHPELALEVAKLNIAFFPNSFNIYDMYGEILAKTGKKDEAILMYKNQLI